VDIVTALKAQVRAAFEVVDPPVDVAQGRAELSVPTLVEKVEFALREVDGRAREVG
jgi:hypothetical protein